MRAGAAAPPCLLVLVLTSTTGQWPATNQTAAPAKGGGVKAGGCVRALRIKKQPCDSRPAHHHHGAPRGRQLCVVVVLVVVAVQW